ncbi:MAG: hypothetical protein A2015_03515 [Spirochaetes bacterium GWF1_31_7]|nr:MAG: hypothetical protein A2Y29_09225 [Spirochaetes bacterium GWE2_31_10]OHD49313.1 MAG: hypothetical protein A2015_03515 [Spirochaetes bacterium GWF1_31_7]HBD96125.1 hypothetical protein [Spirochaetia bacterium]
MGIDIHIEDENGVTLQIIYSDIRNLFSEVVNKLNTNEFWKCIDPYGDTIFNHLQFPTVVAEINKIELSFIDEIHKREINEIKKLINDINITNHLYLCFVGE